MSVQTSPMPLVVNDLRDWFAQVNQNFADWRQQVQQWWQPLPLLQKVVVPTFAVAASISAIVIGVSIYGYFNAASPALAAAMPPTTSQSAPAAAPSVVATTATSDTLSLIQADFSALSDAAIQTRQAIEEDRAVLNAHSVKIKSVEESLRDNPKIVQAFKDDMERVKKVMSKPLVPLVQLN